MRADRLLSLILLLQVNKSMTAGELAERLEVSKRTIYRDVDVLSSLSIPIYVDRGREGGIRLNGDFQTTLTGLTANDICYFALPVPSRFIDDLGIKPPANSSLMKLLSTAPNEVRSSLEDINNLLYIDIDPWNISGYTTNKELLVQLQNVIWNSFVSKIIYEKPNGSKEYKIKPLALVLKRSVWYLIAMNSDIIKNFRLDRIQSVHWDKVKFNRPKDFNLEAYWQSSVKEFRNTLPRYDVKLSVSLKLYEILKRRKTLRILETEECSDSSHILVTATFDVEFQAIQFLFEFGDDIRVVEPNSLIESIKKKARKLLDTYS